MAQKRARLMAAGIVRAIILVLSLALCAPARAQISVLDTAQDGVSAPVEVEVEAEAPPPCGTQPLTIARMAWPSAELLAEIHARILAREYGCQVQVVPGDLAATASAMGSTGQPAVAPEMWVTRVAEVWNAAIAAQMLRPAANSYAQTQLEGWFVPGAIAAAHPELKEVSQLKAILPALNGGKPVPFISCPVDWACSLINRNLVAALGLEGLVEIVEPDNRFAMDRLIAEAVSRKEAFLVYYWQPNAVLAQFDFSALDMGAYDAEAMACLAQQVCAEPRPSAFPSETVVVALAEWVFTDTPAIAAYFQRSSLPLTEMNRLLARLNETGETLESVAEHFVAERGELWKSWVGKTP